MNNGLYFSILATICWVRYAPKYCADIAWVLFIALAVASKMGWLP